jgi:hypothetical protein
MFAATSSKDIDVYTQAYSACLGWAASVKNRVLFGSNNGLANRKMIFFIRGFTRSALCLCQKRSKNVLYHVSVKVDV